MIRDILEILSAALVALILLVAVAVFAMERSGGRETGLTHLLVLKQDW